MGDTVNQSVLIWARGKAGQQVGSGECWDLADKALRQSGASSSTTTGKDDDYVWGEAVALKDATAGDVLQFRDYVVTTTITTDVTFEDGSGEVKDEEKEVTRDHHTAIVDSVGAGVFVVLEQNFKRLGRKVQRNSVQTVASGPTTTTTHKSMKHPNGGMRSAKVLTTVTIAISGSLWCTAPSPTDRSRGALRAPQPMSRCLKAFLPGP